MWRFFAEPEPKPEPLPAEPVAVYQSKERRRCDRCHHLFDADEESAMLRPGICWTCECDWIQSRFERLIGRLGRKATLAAFRRLTK